MTDEWWRQMKPHPFELITEPGTHCGHIETVNRISTVCWAAPDHPIHTPPREDTP